jgi:ppGpp synthetase/RelA/SpoT-type nucleotidyltranferase
MLKNSQAIKSVFTKINKVDRSIVKKEYKEKIARETRRINDLKKIALKIAKENNLPKTNITAEYKAIRDRTIRKIKDEQKLAFKILTEKKKLAIKKEITKINKSNKTGLSSALTIQRIFKAK